MKKGIILGISGALGKNLAEKLIGEGYSLIGSYNLRKDEDLEKNEKVELIQLNISNKEEIDKFVEKIEKLGPIDFFTSTISNIPTLKKFVDIPQETFEKDIQVNVLNHIYLIKKLIPVLKEGSNIVFVLSEQVLNNRLKYVSSYVISKYAMLGLMNVLSGELESKKIRVNAVSPGMMETKFIEHLPSFVSKSYVHSSPNKRFITPEEVSDEIIKILKNKDLNGKNVPVGK